MPEVVLSPEDMLLVMELAGYRYLPGSDSYFPVLRRADAPGAQIDGMKKSDIVAHVSVLNRGRELRGLFKEFIKRQEGKK